MLNIFWGSDGTGIHLGLKNQGSSEIEGSNPFFPTLSNVDWRDEPDTGRLWHLGVFAKLLLHRITRGCNQKQCHSAEWLNIFRSVTFNRGGREVASKTTSQGVRLLTLLLYRRPTRNWQVSVE